MKTSADIVNFSCLTLKERKHDRKPKARVQINKFLSGCTRKNFHFHEMNKRQNKHTDGCFGRSLGHIEILKYAIKIKLTHIIISEDDVEWNVLLLQGLSYKPYEKVKKLPWVRVSDCEAPGCYLVHGDYFETLL